MSHPTTNTPRPARARPQRTFRPTQLPTPGIPPPPQHPRALRTHQPPSPQPPLDAIRIGLYRHHSASVRTARPSRGTPPRDNGRAVAYPNLDTVTAPTNNHNPPRPPPTRSAHSTTQTRPYVVTLDGGQQMS